MFNFLKRFFSYLSKRNIKIGSIVLIYFPNVKEYYKLEVSSIMLNSFKAKFLNENDWDKSNVETYYNQIDNDILFDKKTFLPIKFEKRGKR